MTQPKSEISMMSLFYEAEDYFGTALSTRQMDFASTAAAIVPTIKSIRSTSWWLGIPRLRSSKSCNNQMLSSGLKKCLGVSWCVRI